MVRVAEAPRRWPALDAGAIPTWWGKAAYLPVIVLGGGLLALAAIQLRWAAAFLAWPTEIVYGEALLQDHAARLLRGEALYQPLGQPSFSVAAYTPLFYALSALGQLVVGPNLQLARVISVLAAASIVLLLGWLAARAGRGAAAALVAALMFLALGFPTPLPSFALAKEDTFGVALGVASIATLAGGQTRRRVLAAALLAALAILTKQTLIAAAIASTIALAEHRRPHDAVRFAAVCAGIVLLVVVTLELTTHAFLANAVYANAQPFRADILLTNLATLKAYQAGPLAVAALGTLRRLLVRRAFEDTLLAVYWVATLLPVVGLASPGSAQNYWIELAASSAVLATTEMFTWLGSRDLRKRLIGAAFSAVPLVNVVVAGRLALIWLPAINQYDHPASAAAEFSKIVEVVHSTPGPVLAEPLDALLVAGKPTLVEPWAADALYQSGTWDIMPFVQRVCAGEIRLAVFSHSLEDHVVAYQGYGIWPQPLIRALSQQMAFDKQVAGRYVYVARSGSNCGSQQDGQ